MLKMWLISDRIVGRGDLSIAVIPNIRRNEGLAPQNSLAKISLGGRIMFDSANPNSSRENLGTATLSRAVSNASAWLHNHSILVLAIIFCALVAATLWHLS